MILDYLDKIIKKIINEQENEITDVVEYEEKIIDKVKAKEIIEKNIDKLEKNIDKLIGGEKQWKEFLLEQV